MNRKAYSKNHVWLNLPRKTDEVCNFCAFLKSTILTQKNIFKKRVLKQKFYKKWDFEIKKLKHVRFCNKNFKECQILKQNFCNKSDFEFKIIKRVRFCGKIIYLKVSPKSTLYFFHNAFLHITMYSYSPQNLRQLDNSIRHCSNNTSYAHFRKDLDPRFCYGVLFLLSINSIYAEPSCYK